MKKGEGKLIFRFAEVELEEKKKGSKKKSVHALSVVIELEVIKSDGTKLTHEDSADTPEAYLKNGRMFGFLDALVEGLQSDRGISFLHAAQNSLQEAKKAKMAIEMGEMLTFIEELSQLHSSKEKEMHQA